MRAGRVRVKRRRGGTCEIRHDVVKDLVTIGAARKTLCEVKVKAVPRRARLQVSRREEEKRLCSRVEEYPL